jgi:ribonuclease G
MKTDIIINSDDLKHEIAVLEDDKLMEYYFKLRGEEEIIGNIYCGVVKNVLPQMSAVFVDIGLKDKNVYLPFKNLISSDKGKNLGDIVYVQVVKGSLGNKSPEVTEKITLPGKFVVYLPTSPQHRVFLSQKIKDREKREKLLSLGRQYLPPVGSIILRTESAEVTESEIRKEIKDLQVLWSRIEVKKRLAPCPGLVWRNIGIENEIIRDTPLSTLNSVIVTSPTEYGLILDFAAAYVPSLKDKIKPYYDKKDIFELFNIEKDIKNIYKPRVDLPSGAYLLIEHSSAAWVIDVNSGGYVGTPEASATFEETAFCVNMEAIPEIVRQIRLRDLSGIIIIDFINIKNPKRKNLIYETLRKEMRCDRAKHKILPFNSLGLVEISRERKYGPLFYNITEECKYCRGSGYVLSKDILFNEIKRVIKKFSMRGVRTCHLDVNELLAEELKYKFELLEKEENVVINIRPNKTLPYDDYRITIK